MESVNGLASQQAMARRQISQHSPLTRRTRKPDAVKGLQKSLVEPQAWLRRNMHRRFHQKTIVVLRSRGLTRTVQLCGSMPIKPRSNKVCKRRATATHSGRATIRRGQVGTVVVARQAIGVLGPCSTTPN